MTLDYYGSRFEQFRAEEIERANYLRAHNVKVIEIVAEANKNLILHNSIVENFADFYKEMCIISILNGWFVPDVKVPITDEDEEEKEEEEREEEDNKVDEFDVTAEAEYPETDRFLEIIKKKPEDITPDEQREVFSIFPIAASSLGVWL